MSDRLEEIRLLRSKEAYLGNYRCANAHVDWLITEVERLRVAVTVEILQGEHLREEIATLREALEWIADDDQANAYEWQLIAKKALATKEAPNGDV